MVAGNNKCNQLDKNKSILHSPLKLPSDPSMRLCYSIYAYHTVIITNNGSLQGVGNNSDGRISNSLAMEKIDQFTEFYIKDSKGFKLSPISVVCNEFGALYLFSKSNSSQKQLVYCDCNINDGDPVFLDIDNQEPVALFGGCKHVAAINNKGEVIFINRFSIIRSPGSKFTAVSLPNREKASSIACCDTFVVVLSSNGQVFSSKVEKGSSTLDFSVVEELIGCEIVFISGTSKHCFAVTKEGHVFGCGSNKRGQLGIGEEIKSISSFTMISSLQGYKIKAAYAGLYHSLFQTAEGQILSCGSNGCSQLLLDKAFNGIVYLPTKTTITGGATFCIAGNAISIVFIGEDLPTNTPNRRIQQKE